MLTSTPDLQVALKEFIDKEKENRSWDKGIALPTIISAKILPLMYDSIYEKEE